jgi:hypothetical protein
LRQRFSIGALSISAGSGNGRGFVRVFPVPKSRQLTSPKESHGLNSIDFIPDFAV